MIKVIRRVSLKEPIFIACWPGMGEVAIKAGLFLKNALGCKPFAKIRNSGLFQPQAIFVQKGIAGLPDIDEGTFYFSKGMGLQRDIILFLAQAQPSMEKAYQFAELIINFASSFKASQIITFAALPQAIEHTQEPSVWMAATDSDILSEYSKYELKILEEGHISGLNGLMLGVASEEKKMKGVCFLGEIPFYTIQIENPKATLAVLRVLDKRLRLNLNFKPLEDKSSFLDKEIDKLISYLKGESHSQESLPLSEEDIQKIKKDLESFTKLPQSARQKIEGLFKKSSRNLSHASELKKILDEWGVYREYEDRFLDLFKKKRLDH
ncbi:MAG: PAC2 family protein [Candidatus Omnitrophica bacterium]|nr:PAC2 family protein [Candidatus Omnitrophota bacterium]